MIEPIRIHDVNQPLVDHIKQLLKDAESGDLQGMVSLSIWDDGGTSYGWAPPPKAYHTAIVSRRFIGELEYLKADLMGDSLWQRREEI